jgi:tRNA pseudouridine55 synthase
MNDTQPTGFLLIDKPAGFTSHDVVAKLRRITGIRKIGHAGTLDPFATGLLVVGVGRAATKHLGELMGHDKEYEAKAVLGAVSDTQDLTGQLTGAPVENWPSQETLDRILPDFQGAIDQIPPMYSAKKVKGKKLYELARAGEEIERKPRQVTIHELELRDYTPPHLTFRVHCSAGTYIRTLAHDIGQALGTGAYLEMLRRTKSGDYHVDQAVQLDQLTPENWTAHLLAETDLEC